MKMKVKKLKKGYKKTKKQITKKKRDLSNVSIDEFCAQDFERDDGSESGDQAADNKVIGDDGANSSDSDMDPVEHKKALMKLKETDPEFYSYLQENDKNLLEFNMSDDEDENASDEANGSELHHVPNDKLEVASDESDYEPEGGRTITGGLTKVTLQLLNTWQNDIQKDNSLKTIRNVVEAFHAALQTISEAPDDSVTGFKVEGSAIFNGVVQLCILYLPDAFKRVLNADVGVHFEPHKCKRFGKVKGVLKLYLMDLITILQNVTSIPILTILLKHLHQMLPYTRSFSSLNKSLLRILLKFWSSAEETVRVVAFLCMLRIAISHKQLVLETLLKSMYVKYVENAKFVSPNTLPGINFMKHSLTEIYLLDPDLSYSHAFLYIRQLAIHLRNAVTLKKKENFQAVYNWQYINSLRFWSELVTLSKKQSMLRSLLYPLVQIIIGTIKVIPTAQYYPLRFHCVEMLTHISRETNTFIPILPFLLEVLMSYDFNKKHKAVSMKPISLICILRMSKSQLQENGFKDSIIETIYQLILENAAKDSHTVSFPDMYVPCIIQLKLFLKKCHVGSYCRKMKQLLDKLEENRKFIETERAKVTFDLKNMSEIEIWENRIKTDGTALSKFYDSWIKIYRSQKLKHLTKNEEMGNFNLPNMRESKRQKSVEEKSEGDSDESDFELRLKGSGEKESDEEGEKVQSSAKPKERKKKQKKKHQQQQKPKREEEMENFASSEKNDVLAENTDIVEDINTDDWI